MRYAYQAYGVVIAFVGRIRRLRRIRQLHTITPPYRDVARRRRLKVIENKSEKLSEPRGPKDT